MKEEKANYREMLASTAALFRLGMEALASESLIRFTDAFLPTMAHGLPENVGPFTQLLNQIVAAQSRRDFLFLADLLEYELSTQIERL